MENGAGSAAAINGASAAVTNGKSAHNNSLLSANAVSMESLDNCSTVSSNEQNSQVRTLFISGLPIDTRPRELYLLFRASSPVGVRFDPESGQTIRLELARSNTKVTSSKPAKTTQSPPIISPANLPQAAMLPTAVGFAPQAGQPAAFAAAMAALSGQLGADHAAALGGLSAAHMEPQHLPFFTTATSEAQMINFAAQQQLAAAAAVQAQANAFQMLTASQVPVTSSHQQHAALAAAMAQIQQQQQLNQSAQQLGLTLNPQSQASYAMPVSMHSQQQALLQAAANQHSLSLTGAGQQMCSTLFIANLGSMASPQLEEELRQLFKPMPGFSRLRMHSKGGSPVAFVEFSDVRHAAVALSALQGVQLAGSGEQRPGAGGIRIEFARSKMGDVNHNNATAYKTEV
ncbi:RNA recognition motif domain-containing protein [Ditylenchus destructor]|uniref:RNA recognition motif domain-containing protein n=1 Tax=Ditylenchus destructor TaxID=166010 RepID=A0AAD4MUU1_9BILA|nr:RNA recognition motif domain-containing protein [Ditylenchus destructor]